MNTKLLALKRLGIEPHSNSVRTTPEKASNFEGAETGKKFEESSDGSISINRYAYRFQLRNGEGGGVYICDTPDLEEARDSLLERYGKRLLATTKAGD